MKSVSRSHKLDNVCYDIRGPIAVQARKMEDEGHRILKLNIGNPAPFGFDAPDDILRDVIHNLPTSQGYSDSAGIYAARVAVMQYYQQMNIKDIRVDDVFIGNGVSEMIMIAMQALLNTGDEVLLPSPDYPLWTAAVSLSSGTPVHYVCDEHADWFPDIDDIKSKLTPNTRAIVLINPNNPTGAVYSKALLEDIIELARQHSLIVFSDEIYDKILYDKAEHTCIASLSDEIFCVTLGGLSKNYRVAGFRAGWLVVSGNKRVAKDYIDGINMLCSMRMCANVPCQTAIQTALGGYQSINDLIAEGGRLKMQRDLATSMLNEIDGIHCVKPMGAMYCFARVDEKKFSIKNDEQMVLDLLSSEKILLVHGRAFNMRQGTYFRLVFLPHSDILGPALSRIQNFFKHYQQIGT
ncbi:pyridoxal phosphate-dependent aminotransferase [Alteromonas ponticola]|uniref:alanine transaminase n=1 Tax=Alteromonas aquimaris TaxID=2998417 RepID=A0ABT3P7D1_9ALTE|nr:pyridoxal phosphate-dependent aminotransferase [Alteromonas aquimaris]MCW8108688.1 pyridoxal phosphate-dependent aminotransferase [Alteromonas aquimaris]